jgi:hypothetical protein
MNTFCEIKPLRAADDEALPSFRLVVKGLRFRVQDSGYRVQDS